jgi:hypothetical protein
VIGKLHLEEHQIIPEKTLQDYLREHDVSFVVFSRKLYLEHFNYLVRFSHVVRDSLSPCSQGDLPARGEFDGDGILDHHMSSWNHVFSIQRKMKQNPEM